MGRIANGALIEREIEFTLNRLGQLRLALRNPDFTTAKRIAAAMTKFTDCSTKIAMGEATKAEVADQLEHGTHRSYDVFAQCTACGRAYWKGAHHEQLEAIVERALAEFANQDT